MKEKIGKTIFTIGSIIIFLGFVTFLSNTFLFYSDFSDFLPLGLDLVIL